LSKRYTVLIVPEGGAQVRKLHIPRWLPKLVLSGGLLFIATFAFLVYFHQKTDIDQFELQHLRVENGRQRLEL